MDIRNKNVFIVTLGCRTNLFETNQIKQSIALNHGINCDDIDKADIVIVNTCCVTNRAMSKSNYMINRVSKYFKVKLVVVCGCYSQYKPSEIQNGNVGIIIGTKYKTQIVDLIKEYNGKTIIKIDDITKEKKFEKSDNTCAQEKTRGIIKIQDGCNFNCSYCIIPLARGRQRSLDDASIIKDIKNMVKNNIKEIVLTGVNTSGYNYEGITFFDLLKQIDKLKGNFRVRISSLEPFQIKNSNIIELITKNKNRWCQTFHLCLQNSVDKILKSMQRKYTFKEFLSMVEYIRKLSPLCSITTDYIVGYPNETNDDFQKSLINLKEIDFSNMHIFPYSAHKGTPAANIKNLVTDKEKKDRYLKINSLCKKSKITYLEKFVGEQVNVLFEKSELKGFQNGHSQYFFPVFVKTTQILTNEIKTVKITKIKNGTAFGEL